MPAHNCIALDKLGFKDYTEFLDEIAIGHVSDDAKYCQFCGERL